MKLMDFSKNHHQQPSTHIMHMAVATSRSDEKDSSSVSEQSVVDVDESLPQRDNVAATATLFLRRATSLKHNYRKNRSLLCNHLNHEREEKSSTRPI
jgi:hypothetical protein